MISWNYRVFREENDDHIIREVYYDEKGAILSCTVNAVEPWGESLDALLKDIEDFKAATLLPILTLADVPVEGIRKKRQRNRAQNVSHEQLLAKLGITWR
ncbi:MAG: hypothetical protein AAF821_08010 [Cyanobacteria bacterium P01_D01_bin.156]